MGATGHRKQGQETLLIAGVGLIGGSLGLAARQATGWRVRGLDRPEVLEQALRLGALDEGAPDVATACRGVSLVVLAAPVGAILNLLPELVGHLEDDVLITDTGSTKRRIVEEARRLLGAAATRRFLGGHPMAGKEKGAIANADAGLFRGTRWLLTPESGISPEQVRTLSRGHGQLLDLIAALGAQPLWMEPARHDHVLALLSHLPQLISTALAAALHDEFLNDGEAQAGLLAAGGSGVRDMTRLAASPFRVWRDILMSNSEAVESALTQFQNALEHLRLHLRDRELEATFQDAAELHTELRVRQGKE